MFIRLVIFYCLCVLHNILTIGVVQIRACQLPPPLDKEEEENTPNYYFSLKYMPETLNNDLLGQAVIDANTADREYVLPVLHHPRWQEAVDLNSQLHAIIDPKTEPKTWDQQRIDELLKKMKEIENEISKETHACSGEFVAAYIYSYRVSALKNTEK